MRSIIIFVLSFALLAQGLNDDVGVSRIVGGRPARQREMNFIASLSLRGSDGGYRHFCGGSILTSVWVVSAAHCMIMSANQMTVRIGIDNLREKGTLHRVSQLVPHPNFSRETLRNDIAMIRLYDPVQFSQGVQPIEVIGIDLGGGTAVVASGWGYTDSNQTPTDQLMVLSPTYVMDMQACMDEVRNLPPFGPHVDVGQYCIKARRGQGICQGDSGGPAVYYYDGTPYLVGVFSWNIPCAQGYPDVMTNVKQYIPFMRAVMQQG